jgi:hypothetical protein
MKEKGGLNTVKNSVLQFGTKTCIQVNIQESVA